MLAYWAGAGVALLSAAVVHLSSAEDAVAGGIVSFFVVAVYLRREER